MLFIVPDLGSPFIQGRETAINANWNDLARYNQVQAGQRENAFGTATFGNRLSRDNIDTQNQQLAYNTAFWNNELNAAAFPGQLALTGSLTNQYQLNADPLAQAQVDATLAQRLQGQAAYLSGYNSYMNPGMAQAMPGVQTATTSSAGAITPLPQLNFPTNTDGTVQTNDPAPVVAVNATTPAPTAQTITDADRQLIAQYQQRQDALATNALSDVERMAIAQSNALQQQQALSNAYQNYIANPAPPQPQVINDAVLYLGGATPEALSSLAPGQQQQLPNGLIVTREADGSLWAINTDPRNGAVGARYRVQDSGGATQ